MRALFAILVLSMLATVLFTASAWILAGMRVQDAEGKVTGHEMHDVFIENLSVAALGSFTLWAVDMMIIALVTDYTAETSTMFRLCLVMGVLSISAWYLARRRLEKYRNTPAP